MAKATTKPKFALHLDTIRRAKLGADKAMELIEQGRILQKNSHAVVQEMLFDHVCLCRELLPDEELSDASSIVSRAVQSLQRMHELGEKIPEQKSADSAPGLPPEKRDELEREIKAM